MSSYAVDSIGAAAPRGERRLLVRVREAVAELPGSLQQAQFFGVEYPGASGARAEGRAERGARRVGQGAGEVPPQRRKATTSLRPPWTR